MRETWVEGESPVQSGKARHRGGGHGVPPQFLACGGPRNSQRAVTDAPPHAWSQCMQVTPGHVLFVDGRVLRPRAGWPARLAQLARMHSWWGRSHGHWRCAAVQPPALAVSRLGSGL